MSSSLILFSSTTYLPKLHQILLQLQSLEPMFLKIPHSITCPIPSSSPKNEGLTPLSHHIEEHKYICVKYLFTRKYLLKEEPLELLSKL